LLYLGASHQLTPPYRFRPDFVVRGEMDIVRATEQHAAMAVGIVDPIDRVLGKLDPARPARAPNARLAMLSSKASPRTNAFAPASSRKKRRRCLAFMDSVAATVWSSASNFASPYPTVNVRL